MPENPDRISSICNFYIDGFNIYHRIREYRERGGEDFRWLDYRSLCESILRPGERAGDIYFFTAIAASAREHKEFGGYLRDRPSAERAGVVARHRRYVEALRGRGLRPIFGKFLRGREKQTDVNIAARMIADAALGRCGKCFLFSGDNDFASALRAVEEVSRGATVAMLMTPPFESGAVERRGMRDLETAACRRVVKIRFSGLRGHSLPREVQTARGSIRMPEEYRIF